MTNNFDIGKIPPQAIDLEEAVLGAIIVESSVLIDVLEYLSPESFYKEVHSIIFRSILSLYDSKKQIDLLTISEELRKTNQLEEVGGYIYIAKLTQAVGSASHIIEHAKIVAEKYIRREFIRLGNELIGNMFDENTELLSVVNDFDNEKMNILSFTKDDEKHIRTAVNEMVIHSLNINENKIPKGITTGFTYYDNFSGGIQKGDLIIVAGETSNGKTTLALDILNNTCLVGTNAAIFSFEMTSFQLTARLVSRNQRINSKDIIRGAIDRENLLEIKRNVYRLTESELYIVKPMGSSFNRLKRDIARMVKLYDLDLVAIDYLQLISNPKHGSSSADMIGEIANQLKALAVELNIGIILLSQLARDKSNPRPNLPRLKGSGDIENAADVVIFTYLPFKYNLEYENVNNESVKIDENAIIIIAKGRNIGTSDFILEFKKEVPAFFNYYKEPGIVTNNFYETQKAPF